jgi:hypothetical protein
MRLFDRGPGFVRLTASGKRIVTRAGHLLSSSSDLEREPDLLRWGDLRDIVVGSAGSHRWWATAGGRDCKIAVTPDSGHSIWRRLNGSSACRRTQQPDPERGNPPHRMRRIEADVRSQRRQARLRLKAFLLRQARRHPTRHRGPRPTNTGSRTCTSITKATLSRRGECERAVQSAEQRVQRLTIAVTEVAQG